MNHEHEGRAIVYCEGAFNTPNGKTAHGLARHTSRYKVLSVVDSRYAGQDALKILDDTPGNVPVYDSVVSAIKNAAEKPTHLVIGLAPDGGRLPAYAREAVITALCHGLNVDCGLHDLLSEDPDLSRLASEHHAIIRDIRKPKPSSTLHFFTGDIEKVRCPKIAVLGTDSAIGKRTTTVKLTQALNAQNIKAIMIGTGQTAWLQGVKYTILVDALISDFMTGEIENIVYQAWCEQKPDCILIEGQGSLMNPAYPGGYEILAAARPEYIILQHAPKRKEYDGFPGYPIQDLHTQIAALEMISKAKVIAVTLNHEGMVKNDLPALKKQIETQHNIPAFDVLWEDINPLITLIKNLAKK
ncbi:MAG: DUF1611 domain-containing protein [Deltaproteobacteria bacterium]|nr:DUF1611 domain-containing protein [Deltaproteobacteria bacterium]